MRISPTAKFEPDNRAWISRPMPKVCSARPPLKSEFMSGLQRRNRSELRQNGNTEMLLEIVPAAQAAVDEQLVAEGSGQAQTEAEQAGDGEPLHLVGFVGLGRRVGARHQAHVRVVAGGGEHDLIVAI